MGLLDSRTLISGRCREATSRSALSMRETLASQNPWRPLGTWRREGSYSRQASLGSPLGPLEQANLLICTGTHLPYSYLLVRVLAEQSSAQTLTPDADTSSTADSLSGALRRRTRGMPLMPSHCSLLSGEVETHIESLTPSPGHQTDIKAIS